MDPIRDRRGATAEAPGTFRRRSVLVLRHVLPRRVRRLANVRVERRPPRDRSRSACRSPVEPRPRRSGTFALACSGQCMRRGWLRRRREGE
eukprot:3245027-Pleurochrysis_carterae.AAC.1